jgi:hypothetical protein
MGDLSDAMFIIDTINKFQEYLKRIETKLDTILINQQLEKERNESMSTQLEELETQVAETLGVEQSAITLLQGIEARLQELADELAAQGIDNAKVLALAAELDASEDALAAAVSAVPPLTP